MSFLTLNRWTVGLFAIVTLWLASQEPTVIAQPGAGANGADTPAVDLSAILNWRSIGPANMGGRITALAVFEADPSTYYVGTASGGLLKTTNNGSTFEHQFDKEKTVSIGAVAVAPSNRDIVWVGTGEANPRNSVSYGDGVYVSTDGGKKWKNMGLTKSYQVSRIVIHPTNPDIVYVGALGRLYGPNEERGLFKTTDGGQSWQKIHYVDNKTGVMDIIMNPADPDTLIIATWERQRDAFDSFKGDSKAPAGADQYAPVKVHGAGGGIFRTTDGGKSWTKVTTGLPKGKLGRIGLDWHRKNANLVFACIDTENIGKGIPAAAVYLGITMEVTAKGVAIGDVTAKGPAAQAGLQKGDLLISLSGQDIKNVNQVAPVLVGRKPGDKIALKYQRGEEKTEIELTLAARPGDESTQQRGTLGVAVEANDDGAIAVSEVTAKGPGERAGIKVGDVLLSIDGAKIDSALTLFKTVFAKKPGDKVNIAYQRGKEVKAVEIILDPLATGTADRPYAGRLGGQVENVQDKQGPEGDNTGGIYKSIDGGNSWTRINSLNERPFYFSVVKSDPSDEKTIYFLGVNFYRSTNGGKTFDAKGINKGIHSDHHDLWINPKDGRHMIIGTDGGWYVTYDRAASWEHLNHYALAQYYHVAVDNRKPYNAYGGLQDNGTWGVPSHSLRPSGPTNSDVRYINGGDGFVCRVDPLDPDIVYGESQDGNMMRRNLRTGQSAGIRPKGAGGGFGFGGGGGGKGAPPKYRFNWNTPFILSNHNPHIFYCGGNYVFRSIKQGAELLEISPEITRTKRGSATAIAESPKSPDVLWVGTDDGAVHVTKDGGRTWINVSANFKLAGLPGPRWVASIEPSRTVAGRCYVAFDAHRSDDDEPYVFATENYGETWRSIRANLPTGSTRVMREDRVNPDLLYVGTEFAIFASLDRGNTWMKINGNTLPTVAIHEVAQATTNSEIVVATHGRSLWVLDVASLRQMKKDHFTDKASLYTPSTLTLWRLDTTREGMFRTGTRIFNGTNPEKKVAIDFTMPRKVEKLSLRIADIDGKTIKELDVSKQNDVGVQRVTWDLSTGTLKKGGGKGFAGGGGKGAGGKGAGGKGAGGGKGGGFPGGFGGALVGAGKYRVILEIDGVEQSRIITIEGDPRQPALDRIVDEAEEEYQLRKLLKSREP
jgi:photosystem II stability/assembly factor-like uncharacterized protein